MERRILLKNVLLFLLGLMFIQVYFVIAGVKQQQIRVIDDNNNGVQSEIFKIDKKGGKDRLGVTDKKGYCVIKESCFRGERIWVRPTNPLFYPGEMECPITEENLVVTKVEYLGNLYSNAKFFENKGEYATAAFVYSEIVARANTFDPTLAEYAEKYAIELFSKFLGHEAPTIYDAAQKKDVISPNFKEAIKKFQKENSLRVTGKLDYPTLSKAAGAPIGNFIFRCYSLK